VADNGFQEQVEVIMGRVEEVVLPEKVDIIVSEWMGFYLVHESMLESVIAARDRWLKPGGFVWPNRARLFLSPVSMDAFFVDKHHFWKDVYGFNFSSVIPLVQERVLQQPQITLVEPGQLLSEGTIVREIDLHTVASNELSYIECPFQFEAKKDGNLHGFCAWFDVIFEGNTEEDTIVLSTAPGKEPTHWKQTVFLLPEALQVKSGDPITGRIVLAATKENGRQYDVSLELGGEEDHGTGCECVKCKLAEALGLNPGTE
jgi:hypothetical protein